MADGRQISDFPVRVPAIRKLAVTGWIAPMPASARRPRLGSGFARLEDRTVPALFGIPWPDAQSLTLSFPAAGVATPVGQNDPAAAFAGAPGWQREVLRAFQSWAVQTNANVGVVADGGQPFGARGAVQGDKRFGDVRVGAGPINSPAELAFASPFSWTGTTFAGDVLFDTAAGLQVGNAAGGHDVFTVAAHEAGHVFGLDHSTEAGSVMSETYSYKTGLSAGDAAAVRGLYGVRTPDAYDRGTSSGPGGGGTNDTLATAAALPRVSGSLTQYSAVGDITTATDVDYFKVTVPVGTAAAVGRLKASGTSLLVGRVSAYTTTGQFLGTLAATDPLSNDLTLELNSPLPGTYIVKVEGATGDVFGVGGYRLTVDMTPALGLPLPPLPGLKPLLDGGTNETVSKATKLESKTAGDSRFDYVVLASIESPTDADTYKVRSAAGANALNLLVWGAETDPVWPAVRVFNADGHAVAYRVLANDDGSLSVRVADVVGNKDYSVQVTARAPGSVGGYYLAADYNTFAAPDAGGVATGVLTAAAGTAQGALTINQTGLYQVGGATTLLANSPTMSSGGAGVTVELVDPAGATAATLTTDSNKAGLTRALFLPAGTYTARFQYRAGTTASTAGLRYNLTVHRLSDPIGPDDPDVTGENPPPPPPPPPVVYGGSSDVEPTGLPPVF